ncbi:Zinc finger and BTB domain-containing protein 48 [Folsomia candida]|uniref:Zinc finger and BTB domain-containing protein 48 n=1 Tax=Folsomia candida TaxID=158441 RepID=A0A226D6M2_FOLCA|nr:Zinc finger and BTB domain-containing protein 48 [Folsomia candida]
MRLGRAPKNTRPSGATILGRVRVVKIHAESAEYSAWPSTRCIPTPLTPGPLIKSSLDQKSEKSKSETKSKFPQTDSHAENHNDLNPLENKVDPPLQCPTCSKSFVTKRSLDRHLTRVVPCPSSYLCPVPTCSFSTANKRRFESHMVHFHKDVAIHGCRLCEKMFRKKAARAVHMVIQYEDGEKKFPCEKCGKSFALEENLKRHVELHKVEGIKPLICEVCDGRFKDEKDLEGHIAKR